MSRTDKDTPWWVVAELWKPAHFRCPNAIVRRWWTIERDCDLPAEPLVARYRGSRRRSGMNCHWSPVWPFAHWNGLPGPPKDFRDLVWNGPTRRAVRDDCRKAAKEYRGEREVDTMPPTAQHRHCARWLYW